MKTTGTVLSHPAGEFFPSIHFALTLAVRPFAGNIPENATFAETTEK